MYILHVRLKSLLSSFGYGMQRGLPRRDMATDDPLQRDLPRRDMATDDPLYDSDSDR